MIKSLLIILLIGGVSIRYADLESDAAFVAALLPLVAVLSLIALALWIVALIYRRGIGQSTSWGGGGLNFFDDGSGGGID